MDIALHGAATAEELIPLDDPRSHYAFSKIFEKPGWLANRRNKDRLKVLRNLDAQLSEMLHDGERVSAVAWCQEYSFVESYFLGIWAYLLNRRALLVTQERILLFQIDSRRRPKELKAQIRHGAIQKLSNTWLGSHLRLRLKSKRWMLLSQIPRSMRKSVRETIEAQRKTASPSNVVSREHLCPHCWEPIVDLVPSCPKCRGTFKSPARARWLSLAFPGLGDLYLGHTFLGWLQIVAAVFWWGLLAPAILTDSEVGLPEKAVILGVLALVMHGLDAVVTGYTAKKGLYPEKPGPASR